MSSLWDALEKHRQAGEELANALAGTGWALVETHGVGFRAKKRYCRQGDWNECTGRTPKELLANINAEIKRVEERKKRKSK